MKTSQLVKAEAEVVTIVSLRRGDVYKRLEAATTYRSDQIKYGVVTEIAHNGEDAFIAAVEFSADDYTGELARKVFSTGANLNLFACEPAEYIAAAADLKNAIQRKINKAAEAHERAVAAAAEMSEVLATVDLTRATTGTLEPETAN